MERLLILDSNSLLNRAFYAIVVPLFWWLWTMIKYFQGGQENELKSS